MARIVIDPVTRIEGHLRIEVEVNDHKVTDAWSSGTMFAASSWYCVAAILEKRGYGRNASVAYAPPFTR